ncbi:MAG: hypothetical protein PHE55_05890 [Methylococcaceae bacterium]|nr:hypothetical protein [Methylococcaceae bacterium]
MEGEENLGERRPAPVRLRDACVPVREPVRAVCEMLGYDLSGL